MPEYKIIIENKDQELEASLNPNDINETTSKKLQRPNQKKPKKEDSSEDPLKALNIIGSAIAASRIITDPAIQHIAETHQLEGETLKSQRLASQYNNISKNIDLGLGILSSVAIAVVTKNPLFLAQQALSIAQQALGVSMEVRKYTVQKNVDLYKQTYMSQRLVKNISEVR
jgi:3-deoxy-D-arabino-heptulosonate 7-phosphate (DAHP) synthase class II